MLAEQVCQTNESKHYKYIHIKKETAGQMGKFPTKHQSFDFLNRQQ